MCLQVKEQRGRQWVDGQVLSSDTRSGHSGNEAAIKADKGEKPPGPELGVAPDLAPTAWSQEEMPQRRMQDHSTGSKRCHRRRVPSPSDPLEGGV